MLYYEVTFWARRVCPVTHQQFTTQEEADAFNLAKLRAGYSTRGVQKCVDQQSFMTNPELDADIPF